MAGYLKGYTTGYATKELVVTSRHVGNSGTGSAQTLASSSVAPTGGSLLLVFASAQNDAAFTDQDWQAPTGGSLTYTEIVESADAIWDTLPDYRISGCAWRATVGGSPSAHTITVDAHAGTTSCFYDIRTVDITGASSAVPVQSKAASGNKPQGNTETGTVVLDSPITNGSLLVVYFSAGADGGGPPASPTAGSGKTFTALSTAAGPSVAAGLWYRVCDGSESQTITCSDLGQQVGNYVALAVEIPVPAATPGPSLPILVLPPRRP